jgi:hypothetical protein
MLGFQRYTLEYMTLAVMNLELLTAFELALG